MKYQTILSIALKRSVLQLFHHSSWKILLASLLIAAGLAWGGDVFMQRSIGYIVQGVTGSTGADPVESLRSTLSDPSVKAFLGNIDPHTALNNPQAQALLNEPEFKELLGGRDPQALLNYAFDPKAPKPTVQNAEQPNVFWAMLNTLQKVYIPLGATVGMLFANQIAYVAERKWYPFLPKSKPPIGLQMWMVLTVGGSFVFIQLIAIILGWFYPIIGTALDIIASAYILARSFFIVASLRHFKSTQIEGLWKKNKFVFYTSGMILSFLFQIPILSIFVPLLAPSLIVHCIYLNFPQKSLNFNTP